MRVVKKPYVKRGKLHLGGRKKQRGDFLSGFAKSIMPIVLPFAKEILGLGKKIKHRRTRRIRRIKFRLEATKK